MTTIVALLGLVLAVLLWGISFISLDAALIHVGVMELNIIRFIVAGMILWLIQWLRPKKLSIEISDMPMMFFAGICGTAGYYYFENLAVTMMSPGMVSVVTGAIPVTTIVMAMLFFGKKTKFRNIFLVFLSFAGVIVLMNPFGADTGRDVITGVWTVMLANMFWSLYSLINERFNKTYDKLQVLTVQYTAGLFVLSGIYIYDLSSHPEKAIFNPAMIMNNEALMGHLVFICVFVSIGAYFFYNYALDHIGVMITALFINVVPVVTLIISVSMGIETLSFNKVAGCLLVVVAIFFIEDI